MFREFLTQVPVKDTHGTVFCFSTNTDITLQKEAENALRESEHQLRIALETAKLGSPEPAIFRNEQPEVFASVLCEFWVQEGAAFTYEFLLAMIHPDDQATNAEPVEKAFQGTPTTLSHTASNAVPDGTNS